jgi:RNA polymerase sigma factor (sigma-70 family)
MLGTFRNLQTFEHRGEWALQGYLRQAVTNRIRDRLRRFEAQPRRTTLIEGAARDASPLEAAMGKETFARYERALERLGDVEREAVIARLELASSYNEIATLIEKPTAAAARMTVTRALAKLAQLMA